MNALLRFVSLSMTSVLVLTVALALGACKPEGKKDAAAVPAPEALSAEAPADIAAATMATAPAPGNDISAFLPALQAAMAADDRAAVAAMVRYPLTIYKNGTATAQYPDADSLIAAYDTVFTPAVRDAVRSATPESLFTNADGAMIGNGEIWIDTYGTPLMIKAINPDPQN